MNQRLKEELSLTCILNVIRRGKEPVAGVALMSGTELYPVEFETEIDIEKQSIRDFDGNLTCKVYGPGGRRLGVCVIDTRESFAGWQPRLGDCISWVRAR